MKRHIYNQLLKWKDSEHRKPLMLYGARQVGKTYILKEFGSREFDNMVYINCYKNPMVEALFASDKDVNRILLGLSALSGEEIKEEKTLVFLDEIQDIPDAVAALKYFREDAPRIAVVAAGSLLGVMNMEGTSFPTGQVDIMHMYPMTFTEFLEAVGENRLVELLQARMEDDVVNALLPRYVELLRQYYFVGGMPEAVAEFAHNRNPEAVRKIQLDILAAYDADIAKHAGRETQKARLVFQSIPSQLAKENKRFVFGALKKGARAAEYENAIQWLVDAGLVYKVPRLSKVDLPLSFYMNLDAFKLFLLDTGLLGAMARVPAAMMLISDNVFSEFKGAFTENYVLTQMICVPDTVVAYYSKENSTMEIDFVVQAGASLLPVEVKAEENVRARSLRQFVTVDKAGSGLRGIRFSMKGFADQGWMENIPLFAVHPFISRLAAALPSN
ncbi:MAG: ATP-binding protein [Muribaculaceae bacterium]|nr:ATP-binding protein [Muribaculaceae bacterium]